MDSVYLKLIDFAESIGSFIFIITIIVFVHEFGHFYMARLFGVKVKVFSIGFGRSILWWHDKKGTKWSLGWLPLGGYVQMYGDVNPSSMPDIKAVQEMDKKEQQESFYHKKLWQKAIIVAAGPVANYILAILVLTWINYVNGISVIIPEVTTVIAGTPAELSGIKAGDVITRVDGKEINNLNELQKSIIKSNGASLLLNINRNNENISVEITPYYADDKNPSNNINKTKDKPKVPTIGIICSKVKLEEVNLGYAGLTSLRYTYEISVLMLEAIKDLFTGGKGVSEIGGPIKIAQYSAKSVKEGKEAVLQLIYMLSLNLGLVNLLPIPLLDGGHLLYYSIQAFYGKPLPINIQLIGFRLGFALLMIVMLYATWNDVRGLLG